MPADTLSPPAPGGPLPDAMATRHSFAAYTNEAPPALRLSVVTPVYNERHLVETSLRRVLALRHELIASLELIVVDDCSTDGSREILQRLAAEDDRIVLVLHERNGGKGAAVRTGFEHATGDVTIVHDADLEYHPEDIPGLLLPFVKEGADAVYGSRYLSAPYRRALMHRHTMLNRTLTFLSNWLTDLSLTDLETCYKAVRTRLLRSIPLRSTDFRFEVELTFKLAKRRAAVYEVPIRYFPRTYAEGKKIGMRDGVLALLAMLRYTLIDDLYKADEYGARLLREVEKTRRFTLWLGDLLRPYVGDRVLEIGAGIGTLTSQLIPRELYVAADDNRHYLDYLCAYAIGKPYLHVVRIDPSVAEDVRGLDGQFDTVLLVHAIEHLPDDVAALRNVRQALQPGGRVVVLVPQHPALAGTLDDALNRRRRYTPEALAGLLGEAGFRVERTLEMNRVSTPAWWLHGRVLRRRRLSRVELKTFDTLIPLYRRIDDLMPWSGLSLIAVGVRE